MDADPAPGDVAVERPAYYHDDEACEGRQAEEPVNMVRVEVGIQYMEGMDVLV